MSCGISSRRIIILYFFSVNTVSRVTYLYMLPTYTIPHVRAFRRRPFFMHDNAFLHIYCPVGEIPYYEHLENRIKEVIQCINENRLMRVLGSVKNMLDMLVSQIERSCWKYAICQAILLILSIDRGTVCKSKASIIFYRDLLSSMNFGAPCILFTLGTDSLLLTCKSR